MSDEVAHLKNTIAVLESRLRREATKCFDCGGSGRNPHYRESMLGGAGAHLMLQERRCRHCDGTGYALEEDRAALRDAVQDTQIVPTRFVGQDRKSENKT